jgi:hypothetical protein
MILPVKITDYLYEMVAGKSKVGNKRNRGRERDREEQIKGVRGGAWERTKNGVGCKWPLEMTHENLGD